MNDIARTTAQANKACNCWIAILNNYGQSELNDLYLNNYIDRLMEVAGESQRMAKFHYQFIAYFPKDYIDKRKSMATLFDYCPDCGAKIDWRKLRKVFNKEKK